LASSGIYILNDIIDKENDKLHPFKKNRPLAKGIFSVKQAVIYTAVFLTGSVTLAFCLQWPVTLLVISYILLNVLYCFIVKHIPVLDIVSISSGFIIRILAGGIATNTVLSYWIIIITFLLMCSIALAKRKDDMLLLRSDNLQAKPVLMYSSKFINTATLISFSLTLVVYFIYSISDDVAKRMHSNYVYLTSIPVALGIIRYMQLLYKKGNATSPVKVLFSDFLLSLQLLSGFSCFTTFYMRKEISNWGNYPAIKANLVEPTTITALKETVTQNETLIARGNGRCYGDSALYDTIASTLQLNKFIFLIKKTEY